MANEVWSKRREQTRMILFTALSLENRIETMRAFR